MKTPFDLPPYIPSPVRKIIREMEHSHDEMRDFHQELKKLLIFIIQTLDSEFSAEVQNTNNPIGIIRSKVDRVLNK